MISHFRLLFPFSPVNQVTGKEYHFLLIIRLGEIKSTLTTEPEKF